MIGCECTVFLKMKMSKMFILNYWNNRIYFIIKKKLSHSQEAYKACSNTCADTYLYAHMNLCTCM